MQFMTMSCAIQHGLRFPSTYFGNGFTGNICFDFTVYGPSFIEHVCQNKPNYNKQMSWNVNNGSTSDSVRKLKWPKRFILHLKKDHDCTLSN